MHGNVSKHGHTQTHTHTYTCTHAHTHTQKHIHTHTRLLITTETIGRRFHFLGKKCTNDTFKFNKKNVLV